MKVNPLLMDDLIARIRDASSVLFITGAGISADSGLPTYRGVGGLYEGSITAEGIPIEEALSNRVFVRDPALTWRYIRQIEEASRGAKPNEAHEIIALSEQVKPRIVTLTQNVDGLHVRAGSKELIEIHGNVHRIVCTSCERRREIADFQGLDPLPRCEGCGAVERPEIVLFGEALPRAELMRLDAEVRRGFDVVISIGTSSGFPYIAQPVYRARMEGALTVEINPADTAVSEIVEYRLRMRAVSAMSKLRAALLS